VRSGIASSDILKSYLGLLCLGAFFTRALGSAFGALVAHPARCAWTPMRRLGLTWSMASIPWF